MVEVVPPFTKTGILFSVDENTGIKVNNYVENPSDSREYPDNMCLCKELGLYFRAYGNLLNRWMGRGEIITVYYGSNMSAVWNADIVNEPTAMMQDTYIYPEEGVDFFEIHPPVGYTYSSGNYAADRWHSSVQMIECTNGYLYMRISAWGTGYSGNWVIRIPLSEIESLIESDHPHNVYELPTYTYGVGLPNPDYAINKSKYEILFSTGSYGGSYKSSRSVSMCDVSAIDTSKLYCSAYNYRYNPSVTSYNESHDVKIELDSIGPNLTQASLLQGTGSSGPYDMIRYDDTHIAMLMGYTYNSGTNTGIVIRLYSDNATEYGEYSSIEYEYIPPDGYESRYFGNLSSSSSGLQDVSYRYAYSRTSQMSGGVVRLAVYHDDIHDEDKPMLIYQLPTHRVFYTLNNAILVNSDGKYLDSNYYPWFLVRGGQLPGGTYDHFSTPPAVNAFTPAYQDKHLVFAGWTEMGENKTFQDNTADWYVSENGNIIIPYDSAIQLFPNAMASLKTNKSNIQKNELSLRDMEGGFPLSELNEYGISVRGTELSLDYDETDDDVYLHPVWIEAFPNAVPAGLRIGIYPNDLPDNFYGLHGIRDNTM